MPLSPLKPMFCVLIRVASGFFIKNLQKISWTSLLHALLQHGLGYNTDHCWTPVGLFIWGAVLLFIPHFWISIIYLRISIIHLWISIIHLWISIIHLWISINELWIPINELWISLNELWISLIELWISYNIFLDIQKIKMNYGYP